MIKKSQTELTVTEEALRDFMEMSPLQKLTWLDQTRAFLSKTMPKKTQKIYDELRKRGR